MTIIITIDIVFWRFPMEMRVVHLHVGTEDLEHTEEGVAVLGFFFKISVRYKSLNYL